MQHSAILCNACTMQLALSVSKLNEWLLFELGNSVLEGQVLQESLKGHPSRSRLLLTNKAWTQKNPASLRLSFRQHTIRLQAEHSPPTLKIKTIIVSSNTVANIKKFTMKEMVYQNLYYIIQCNDLLQYMQFDIVSRFPFLHILQPL